MSRLPRLVPTAVTLTAVIALILYGPIAQLESYHNFADQRAWLGIPNAADVLSSLGFAVIGCWGLHGLWSQGNERAIRAGWPGYRLFLLSLILTTLGSAFYHLAPDNGLLIWDRLPIALACGGLLAGVRADWVPNVNAARTAALLATVAMASVLWWYVTQTNGQGDLRPYLLLQALPLFLIPLWQFLYHAPRADRLAFGVAIALYAAAKVAELLDHQVFASLHWMSGHTLKHLLATAAAAVIAGRLLRRSHSNLAARCVPPHPRGA